MRRILSPELGLKQTADWTRLANVRHLKRRGWKCLVSCGFFKMNAIKTL